MPQYVDGFVIAVAKKNLDTYFEVAKKASKVWMEHGAVEYRECVGEDLKIKGMLAFPKMAKCKPTETVVFSWIVYKSRAHRDRVNAQVMKDPRIAEMVQDCASIFDVKKMAYGGFETRVKA